MAAILTHDDLAVHALERRPLPVPATGSAAPAPPRSRLARAIDEEEQAGLVFAFWARVVALIGVALWLPFIVQSPRLFYYLTVLAAFFALGLIPFLLRRSAWASPVRFLFVLLDVILVATVVIVPPPIDGDVSWPIQMRVRSTEYLYLVLVLVGSALSYSPLIVLWTGLCVVAVWSVGVLALYNLPDTVRFDPDAVATAAEALRIVIEPTYVSLGGLMNEVVLTLIATGVLAAAVARSRSMLFRQTRAEVARASFARYVSPDLADAMTKRLDHGFGQPAQRKVAVLFADIVGFTALAEQLPPRRIVTLLSNFHERCCRIVFDHGGTLDKYLGDGFMATFGGLEHDPEAARKAMSCALALQAEMDRWNAKRMTWGGESLTLAIGVHYGRAVVGNIGAANRLEHTVVGDTVNIASRLEQLTRETGCRIAVSEACLEAAKAGAEGRDAFELLGSVQLRGRKQPVTVHTWPPHCADDAREAAT
ncbi:adenylate/guanylate cyclase domain-containing protein [Marinivivus vitaminiproducens]|uniref:adenylate/guanylate cyclase domain-containing protein n=1 Tax=Marinivivus vitaminiproducens TaxID=3035935 RepID=UPI0027A025CA|nr:adenylate/guanylate cyclase domain-containing protein [Geminicoccaceae bacterium SCSIO 64248]